MRRDGFLRTPIRSEHQSRIQNIQGAMRNEESDFTAGFLVSNSFRLQSAQLTARSR